MLTKSETERLESIKPRGLKLSAFIRIRALHNLEQQLDSKEELKEALKPFAKFFLEDEVFKRVYGRR